MQIQDMIQFTSKGQKSERLIGVVTEIKELPSGIVYLVRQITKTPGVINRVGKTHRISDRLGNLDSVFVISNMNEEKFSETIAWLDKH
jgi:hypothetical protein